MMTLGTKSEWKGAQKFSDAPDLDKDEENILQAKKTWLRKNDGNNPPPMGQISTNPAHPMSPPMLRETLSCQDGPQRGMGEGNTTYD